MIHHNRHCPLKIWTIFRQSFPPSISLAGQGGGAGGRNLAQDRDQRGDALKLEEEALRAEQSDTALVVSRHIDTSKWSHGTLNQTDALQSTRCWIFLQVLQSTNECTELAKHDGFGEADPGPFGVEPAHGSQFETSVAELD